MDNKFLFGVLIFIILTSSIGSVANNRDDDISSFASNDMVASETGIDMFIFSNVIDDTLDIVLEEVITDFDIAIVDSDYIYAGLYSIFTENGLDPILNPHLLAISSTTSQFDSISYKSIFDTVYLLVYSLDVLNGEPEDLKYILTTNIEWEKIDPSIELEYQKQDTIFENSDEYLDENEYKIYELDIPANQVVDIYVEITDNIQAESTLIVILFEGNSGQDLLDAFVDLDEALNSGSDLPESVLRYGIVFSQGNSDIISYFPFISSETISLRLGIMSVNTFNPSSMNIIIETTIETLDFEESVISDYTSFNIVGIVGAVIVIIVGFFLIKTSKKRRDEMINKADQGEIFNPALIPNSPPIQQYQQPQAYPLPSNQYREPYTPTTKEHQTPIDPSQSAKDPRVNFCPNCGGKQIDSVKFCSMCGEQLR